MNREHAIRLLEAAEEAGEGMQLANRGLAAVREGLRRIQTEILEEGNSRPVRCRGIPEAEQNLLKRLAVHPASLVPIRFRSDRDADVSFNEERPFRLPGKMALLLRLIASGPLDKEGIAGFVPVEKILSYFVSKHTKHAMDQLVYRLRRSLYKKNFNPYWIETCDRPRGLRFRTRKLTVLDER